MVYALVPIGFTLIFGVLNVVNFAHGEAFTLGSFAGLFLTTAFTPPLLGSCLRSESDVKSGRKRYLSNAEAAFRCDGYLRSYREGVDRVPQ